MYKYTPHTCTVESRDYAPPFCMLALGKSGEGAYTRDRDIFAWRPLPTDECHMARDLWLFDGETLEKRQSEAYYGTNG